MLELSSISFLFDGESYYGRDRFFSSFSKAPVHYISNDFGELIKHASNTLPIETEIKPELLPTPSGLCYIDYPLSWTAGDNEISVPNDRLLVFWTQSRYETGEDGLSLFWFTEKIASKGKFFLSGANTSPYLEFGVTIGLSTPGLIEPVKFLITSWFLMKQGLADFGEKFPRRQTSRRAARNNCSDPPIRVIYLRKQNSRSGPGCFYEWNHRWIVRGHWRMQACGPGWSETKPVWVAPHVKGPDDKPLLTGEKVYNWSR